jgi:Flp pilus assembly protein TadD
MLGWVFVAAMLLQPALPALADSCEDDPAAIGTDKDYASGRLALERKDWAHAVAHFERAARRFPDNADIQSDLALAYHRVGKPDLAFRHYRQALKLNPRHRGAHALLGEAFLAAGDVASAEQHLEALRRICLLPCDELMGLERAIGEYRTPTSASR